MVQWFFLVWELTSGYGFLAPSMVDRIVMPTREACEAARDGLEAYAAGEQGVIHQADACRPVGELTGTPPEPR